jgi:HicB family
MDLNEYAESLRSELLAITKFASDDVSRAAQMLAESLDSSVRLALLDVLSAAADEITDKLEDAVVDVRLSGMRPEFVVNLRHEPDEDSGQAPMPPIPVPDAGDEAGQARITLRIPESVKSRVEAAAAGAGLSVNAWLSRAIAEALDGSASREPRRKPTIGKRYTGFARS